MRIKNVTYIDPAVLTPRAKNPRTHSKRQIRQIAASIEQLVIRITGGGRGIRTHGTHRRTCLKNLGFSVAYVTETVPHPV